MSDNSNNDTLQPGSQPLQNNLQVANPEGTTNADQDAGQNQDGPITRKEVMDLINQNYRQVQSLTDKMASNLDRSLSEKLTNFNKNAELMKKSGVQLSEADLAKARQQIYDETLASIGGDQSNPNQPGLVNQQGTQGKQPASDMDQMITQINEQYGGAVMENDPEAAMVDMSNPWTFIKTYEQAAEAKAKRLETPAAARLSSMGMGSNPSFDAETLGAQLLELQSQPQTPEVKAKRREIVKRISDLEGK